MTVIERERFNTLSRDAMMWWYAHLLSNYRQLEDSYDELYDEYEELGWEYDIEEELERTEDGRDMYLGEIEIIFKTYEK